jgi:hypothetical protein
MICLFEKSNDHHAPSKTLSHRWLSPSTITALQSCRSDLYDSSGTKATTAVAKHMVCLEKQRRRKRDRMIYNFWIPLFLVMIALIAFKVVSISAQNPEFLEYFFPSLLNRLWRNEYTDTRFVNRNLLQEAIPLLGFG